MKNWILSALIIVMAVVLSSCATTHPNEKLIVGAWKPEKAEKYFTEEEEKAMKNIQSQPAGSKPAVKPAPSSPSGSTGTTTQVIPAPSENRGGKRGDGDVVHQLNNLIRAESRTPMVVYPDYSAAKFYKNRTVKATWKLKGNGTVLKVKDIEKKERYRIDILEVSDYKLVIVENLPIGGIKITYKKVNESQIDIQ